MEAFLVGFVLTLFIGVRHAVWFAVGFLIVKWLT